MPKILALDFGAKRIGYAISDESQTVAFPRETLTAAPKQKLFEKLQKIINEEGIRKIVLGLPLNTENEPNSMAQKIIKFGQELSQNFTLPVEFIDETGSSNEALAKIPFRKKRREKGFKDAISAQIILQRYLEAL